MTNGEICTAALRYAGYGWSIFPCHQKRPLTGHGLLDATTDPEVIRQWWAKWPDANVAVALAALVVIDIDGPEGEATLTRLIRQFGPLPETLESKTGRGRQLFFAAGGAEIHNSAGKLGPGLDIRGRGGYVVLPPSVHPNGQTYEWIRKLRPALLPDWVVILLAEVPTAAPPASDPVPKGRRNTTLASMAGSMRRKGFDAAAIEAALTIVNRARCQPPLSPPEIHQIANSMKRYVPADPQKPQDGFALCTLAELLARPVVPTKWVWQDHLAAGTVSAVVSKPKVGKSTFARNLCLAVARGDAFMGLATSQGVCIYLALEERAEDVTADFRAMGADGTEPIHVHADTSPASGILALISLIREKLPLLMVIDPLFRLVRVRDEKAYAETYAALGPLIDISRATGSHVLLSHHSGKLLKADAIDAPLGSTAISGAVSSLIVLKKSENYRTLQTVQRLGLDLEETVLEFEPETKTLSLGGTRFEAERSRLEAKILEFLAESAEPQTQIQIQEGVEGRGRIVRAALTSLCSSQMITKSGEGVRGNPFLYK